VECDLTRSITSSRALAIDSIHVNAMQKQNFTRLCQIIWPGMPPDEFVHENYSALREFFQFQADIVADRQGSYAKISGEEMISVIRQLAGDANVFASTENAVAAVRKLDLFSDVVSDTTILNCVDMALRMMLTLDVQSSLVARQSASPSLVCWDDSSGLAETIRSFFTNTRGHTADMKTGRIEPSMTMAYICNRKGMSVWWTSNLAEHLHIDWKSRIIKVYEHKIFLRNHLRDPKHSMIPPPILEEALDTLNVLFPLMDPPTKVLLERNGKTFNGLGVCSRPRDASLDLGKFYIWRSRMAELIEVMNEEPRGLKQLALEENGKNMLPFLTFWVAIAVGVLTIANLPFAIVSMVYTIRQYELALALACSVPETQQSLSQFCG